MNLREEFPFGTYKPKYNRINVFNKNITAYIKKCTKYPELESNTYNITTINSELIEIEKFEHFLFFNKMDFTLKFKDTEINLNDLLDELKYKDGTHEFHQLFMSKLKDGKFLTDLNLNLHGFFNQNEETFFMLRDCLCGDYFCLPKYEDEKNKLLNYITEKNPNLTDYIITNTFSYDELNKTKKKKFN